ncbi:hypothetical protein VTK26DRAFT_1446 [Humicola hyalothermophila]
MALDLGTVLAVVEVVEKAIAIYERVESLPQQMSSLGRRMETLNIFLIQLKLFVRRKPTTAFSTLYSGQMEDLAKLFARIQADAEKVYDLFERYERGILSRSKGLEFRARWMSRLWFSLVDNMPEKVQAIMEEIDWERRVLSDYLSLMAVARVEPQPDPDRWGPAKKFKAGPATPTPRRNYKVLFVDPYNTGRSVVAEALVRLFWQLTLATGGDWRIGEVQSVGFFVRGQSDCVDVIDSLNYSYPSFRKSWMDGGQVPTRMGLTAVFDNKWCDHPFKRTIADEMQVRQSRGVQKNMFTRFDYVIAFTRREHDNLIKLKNALESNSGGGAPRSRGRARVLQLGSFLSQEGGILREILSPVANPDGSQNRQRWNRAVADIRVALKAFLKQEMEWRQPQTMGKDSTGSLERMGPGTA